jgi:hypothetical protein
VLVGVQSVPSNSQASGGGVKPFWPPTNSNRLPTTSRVIAACARGGGEWAVTIRFQVTPFQTQVWPFGCNRTVPIPGSSAIAASESSGGEFAGATASQCRTTGSQIRVPDALNITLRPGRGSSATAHASSGRSCTVGSDQFCPSNSHRNLLPGMPPVGGT